MTAMSLQAVLQTNLGNASLVAQGVYSKLRCVGCSRDEVEAFFSANDKTGQYGIWFECTNCKHVEHISCGSKPSGFSTERLNDRFQRLDERAWSSEQQNRPKAAGT
jgi:hypothetical protein